MPQPVQASSSFPTAHCPVCDRVVLTYLDFADATELRRCVHCDGALASELRWIKAGQLEAEGYYFGPPPASGGGCGSGCGTCSTRKN